VQRNAAIGEYRLRTSPNENERSASDRFIYYMMSNLNELLVSRLLLCLSER
jgi:hypothetical protein